MMTISRLGLLVAAVVLLGVGTARAAEPIECAFGICLGRTRIDDLRKLEDLGGYRWLVDVPESNLSFERYEVDVVPSSGLISSIVALAVGSWTKAGCDKEFADFKSALQSKYGKATESGKAWTQGSLWGSFNSGEGRTIHLGCQELSPVLGQARYGVRLVYADFWLDVGRSLEIQNQNQSKIKKGL